LIRFDLTKEQIDRLTLEAGPAVVIIWQNEIGGPVQYVSSNIRRLSGYSAKNFMAGEIEYTQLIHTRDLPQFQKEITRYSKHKIITSFTHSPYRLRTKKGQIRWVTDRVYIIRDDTGNIQYYQGVLFDLTEIRNKKRQLAQKEKYYRSILSSIYEDIFVIDREYTIVDVNNLYLKTIDSTANEVIGHKCYAIFYGFDKPCSEMGETCILQEIFNSGKAKNTQHFHKNADGSIKSINVLFSPLKNEEGQITHVIKILRDVSDLLSAQQELAHNEQRYRTLFEESPVALWEMDLSGLKTHIENLKNRGIHDFENYFRKHRRQLKTLARSIKVIDLNQAALALNQIRSKQQYLDRFSSFFNAEALQGFIKSFTKIAEGETKGQMDASSIDFQENRRDIRLKWAVVSGHESSWERVYIAVEDIARQKEAEKGMRILSVALEQSPLSIILTDPDGTIEYVNPQFTRVSGYSAEEALGRNPRILKSGEQPTEFYKELWDTITSGETWHGEFHNRKKDGTLFWEEAAIGPVFNQQGTIRSFIALKMDITQRKVLSEQLNQSQKMESIGRLAGGVAHDFNNLLTIINGYSELIMRKIGKDHAFYTQIKQIAAAGKRAGSLTEQLLAFSRKQIIQPKILDLNLQISDTKKMLQRLIGEDIVLKTKLDERLGLIKADPGQINQIIMNLAVNARDAMPKGGKLVIKTTNFFIDKKYGQTHSGVKPGPYALLMVSDTGIGMDQEIRRHIFEPFFTTKGQGKGTGLGLSTVYGIIKQNHGYIQVYSNPGQGTTFKIFLPIVNKGPEGIHLENIEVKDVCGSETILVVEDEEDVRALAIHILRDKGYRILEAAHGHEALTLFDKMDYKIDLLLTDVVMPGMSGKELSEKLIRHNPEIKVIYTSGYTDEAISHYGVLQDGLVFIQKPYEATKLLRLVRETLDKKPTINSSSS